MIKFQYIAKIFKEHSVLFLFTLLFTGGFQLLLLGVFSTTEILSFLDIFVKNLPPQIQQLMGETFIGQFTVSGIAAFGYGHPFIFIFFSIIAIVLPAKHIGMEMEAGTLELLFSQPVKRIAIVISLWLSSMLAIFLLVGGCVLGTFWGLHINSGDIIFPFTKIIQIGINLWLLMLTINAMTFLIAAYTRFGSTVALRAAGITLFFYFLNYAIKIWPTINFLKHFTIFNYYQHQSLIFEQSNFKNNIIILSVLTLVSIAIALRKIYCRDIF